MPDICVEDERRVKGGPLMIARVKGSAGALGMQVIPLAENTIEMGDPLANFRKGPAGAGVIGDLRAQIAECGVKAPIAK
jgi:hypothetical protein